MAIWQYSFQIVPKGEWDAQPVNELFDELPFWKYASTEVSVFEPIADILEENTSWCNEMVMYGNVDSHCLEIYTDGSSHVESVSLRISFAEDYEGILRSIMEFLLASELSLLSQNFDLLNCNFESIKALIEGSEAYLKYQMLVRTQG